MVEFQNQFVLLTVILKRAALKTQMHSSTIAFQRITFAGSV